MEDKIIPLKEVQTILNIHYNTLNRWIKHGDIRVVILSRTKRGIKQSDLDNFIDSHTGTYAVKQQPDNNIPTNN